MSKKMYDNNVFDKSLSLEMPDDSKLLKRYEQ